MLLQMGSLVFLEVPVLLLPVIVKFMEHTSQEFRQAVNLISSQVVQIQSQEYFATPFILATGIRVYPIFSIAEDDEQYIVDLLLLDL